MRASSHTSRVTPELAGHVLLGRQRQARRGHGAGRLVHQVAGQAHGAGPRSRRAAPLGHAGVRGGRVPAPDAHARHHEALDAGRLGVALVRRRSDRRRGPRLRSRPGPPVAWTPTHRRRAWPWRPRGGQHEHRGPRLRRRPGRRPPPPPAQRAGTGGLEPAAPHEHDDGVGTAPRGPWSPPPWRRSRGGGPGPRPGRARRRQVRRRRPWVRDAGCRPGAIGRLAPPARR